MEEKMTDLDVRSISSLALAYMGDSVYELSIRKYLISSSLTDVNKLHKEAIKYVSALAQSQFLLVIEGQLTEEEKDVVRRGRNAKINTKPKYCDLQDYKRATALEALMGYLYLTGRTSRIEEIMKTIFDYAARRPISDESGFRTPDCSS